MKKKRLGYSVIFAAAFIATLVAALPLALVVSWSGAPITASRIEGTVWDGAIHDMWFDGYPIGTLSVSAYLWPLFIGELRGDWRVDGTVMRGTGVMGVRRDRVTLTDTALSVSLGQFNLRDAFGASMGGKARVDTRRLVLSSSGCEEGDFTVTTNTLQVSAARFGRQGFDLSGDGTCEDGELVLPLAGNGEEGQVTALMRISPNGYHTELVVEPVDYRFAEALTNYGFQRNGDQFSIIHRGDIF